MGGVGIMLAYVASLFVARLVVPPTVESALPLLIKLLPATVLVFLTGLLDDTVGLRPYQKLLGQGGASLLVCWAGLRIHNLAGHEVAGYLGLFLTLLWLMGCTNAFNLIDGADGVASGVGFCTTVTTVIVALYYGDESLAVAAAPLAGALLAFLVYNFTPASVFLGDCGSLWIGFLIGSLGVIWFEKADSAWDLSGPLMAFYVPLLDTGIAITRRFLKGQPVFLADRAHIHHRLLDRGLAPKTVALVFYAASAAGALFALVQARSRYPLNAGLILFFGAAVTVAVRHLRYQEFSVFVRVLREANLRLMVESHLFLWAFEQEVRASSDPEECWHALCNLKSNLGFCTVSLCLAGCEHEEALAPEGDGSWTLHIPLSASEYVDIGCDLEYRRAEVLTGVVARKLHCVLSAKASEFDRFSKAGAKSFAQVPT